MVCWSPVLGDLGLGEEEESFFVREYLFNVLILRGGCGSQPRICVGELG